MSDKPAAYNSETTTHIEATLAPTPVESLPAEVMLGLKIRELRNEKSLSLRALSERSGLNVNTLSLVENGKTSPSVSTLQQIARALDVPMSALFESEPPARRIVFTACCKRPQAFFNQVKMQNLGEDLTGCAVQPFIVTMAPGAGSGEEVIVHTGYEFVYCFSGRLQYRIEDQAYVLQAGDSLVFESHLRHRWQNVSDEEAQILLVIYPTDQREAPGGRHFIFD